MNHLIEIKKSLKRASTVKAKLATLKAVPTAKDVYGVRMPVLNNLAKTYKTCDFKLINELWKSGKFEERMLSAKIIGFKAKKEPVKTLSTIRKFSASVEDWAICDCLSSQSIRSIALSEQKRIFHLSEQLITSKKIWQRRMALVLLEYYTRLPHFHSYIHNAIDSLENENEYYVSKAIHWLKRNMLKKR